MRRRAQSGAQPAPIQVAAGIANGGLSRATVAEQSCRDVPLGAGSPGRNWGQKAKQLDPPMPAAYSLLNCLLELPVQWPTGCSQLRKGQGEGSSVRGGWPQWLWWAKVVYLQRHVYVSWGPGQALQDWLELTGTVGPGSGAGRAGPSLSSTTCCREWVRVQAPGGVTCRSMGGGAAPRQGCPSSSPSLRLGLQTYAHARAHIPCTHTHHAHIHTVHTYTPCTHTFMHTSMHAHNPCTRAHIRAHTHAHIHPCTHVHIHPCARTSMYKHIHACTDMHAHAYTHTSMHTHTSRSLGHVRHGEKVATSQETDPPRAGELVFHGDKA